MTEFDYWHHAKLLIDCEYNLVQLALADKRIFGCDDLTCFDHSWPWSLDDFPRMELSPGDK